jgi:hypothetical protein
VLFAGKDLQWLYVMEGNKMYDAKSIVAASPARRYSPREF